MLVPSGDRDVASRACTGTRAFWRVPTMSTALSLREVTNYKKSHYQTKMSQWRNYFLVLCLLLLGACSGTTFVYNQLDFILPWYVDDYAELNSQQDVYLDKLLVPFLTWHRNQELPAYVKIIEGIQGRLDQPLTAPDVADVFADFEAAWLRTEDKALDWLLELGAQLSDQQMEGFVGVLWEKQEEYDEEYLQRTDEEFYEDSYDNLVDNAKEYVGSLSEEQREQLRESSSRLLRSDQAWIQERAEWLTQLAILLERKPGWQQRVKDAVVVRRESLSPDYVRIYQHNMGAIFEAVELPAVVIRDTELVASLALAPAGAGVKASGLCLKRRDAHAEADGLDADVIFHQCNVFLEGEVGHVQHSLVALLERSVVSFRPSR